MTTNRRLMILGLGMLAAALLLSACLPNLPPRRDDDPNSLYTAAAETIMADVTLSASKTAEAQLTQTAQGTPVPTQTAVLFPTMTAPVNSPTPSSTYVLPTSPVYPTATWYYPTSTQVPPPPPPPPTPLPCDWAQFVKDVTVPDGTLFMPGSNFTKVWRLKNIGSCTWTASYAMVFTSGDRMGAQNVVGLPGVVRPGETVDLGVDLVTPSQPGKYRGYWMLSNHYGQVFGIGGSASKSFWVDIQVRAINSPYAYDFALNMCAATWRSTSSNLTCPGTSNTGKGYVQLLFDPQLENGRRENEQALLTQPELERGGFIQGKYPFYRVQKGDRLMADVGCQYNSQGCDVTFNISYQAQNDIVRDLGSWREVYDGQMTRIDVDLSFLADRHVSFLLSVVNNGKPSAANAIWFVPSIRKGPAGPWWGDLRAVKVAQQFIAQQLGVPPDQVAVTFVEQTIWADTCLGIQQPNQVCAPALVPGYRILLTYGSRKFEAHTDQNGDSVFWLEL